MKQQYGAHLYPLSPRQLSIERLMSNGKNGMRLYRQSTVQEHCFYSEVLGDRGKIRHILILARQEAVFIDEIATVQKPSEAASL